MEINKEPEPITGGAIILDGDQIRELHTYAMTMDSYAATLTSMAIAIRELAGKMPKHPMEP